MNSTHRFLLDVLAAPVGEGVALDLPSDIDWDSFEAASRTFRAYVDHRLAAGGLRGRLPAGVATRLQDGARLEVLLHVQRTALLKNALGALDSAGIDSVLLKGAALAHLAYPRPQFRPMADLDVWVEEAQLDAAVDALGDVGLRIPFRHSQVPGQVGVRVLQRKGGATLVEVHALPEALGQLWPENEVHKAWERAREVDLGGCRARVMSQEDLLVHVCLHASYHHHFDLGLRPVLDAALLLKAQQAGFDWDSVVRRCGGTAGAVWLDVMLRLARDLLGAPVPETLARRLGATPIRMEMQAVAANLTLGHRAGSRGSFVGELATIPTLGGRVRAMARRATSYYSGGGLLDRLGRLSVDVLLKAPRHLGRFMRGAYGSKELESRRTQVHGWRRLEELAAMEGPPAPVWVRPPTRQGTAAPRISVVTPSLGQSDWLRLCIASVADQDASVEHIVQDGGSRDATAEWLFDDPRVQAYGEKDNGMYDAVNRGLRRASGEILAYLNCDEQYLPGTLARVADFFEREPSVDMVFGDAVIVDANCDYLFHRKMLTPLKSHTWLCQLSTLTCGMFFRRKVLDEWDEFFDTSCPVADAEWMLRLIDRRARMAVLGDFTSVFGTTGANLSVRLDEEGHDLATYLPPPLPLHALRPAVIAHHRLRRLFGGVYRSRPFSFDLFTHENPEERLTRHVERPTFRWTW